MRFDPSLQLRRLVVLKDGKRAYDECFHSGVNIIRGVPGEGNSVGKSTIADLIFFALGGELTRWKDEAAICDFTFAEVVFNGAIVTLRREISNQLRRPMGVFLGSFADSESTGADGWQLYPFQRFSDKESFSQVLFRMMDMPEAPSDAGANITMHQLLRLMYVDQMTSVDRIFRSEERDSAQRRQAVGDLLCGAYDDRIFSAQLSLRDTEKLYEAATQQYGALHRVLSINGEGYNLDAIGLRKVKANQSIAESLENITELKKRRFDEIEASTEEKGLLNRLKSDLDDANNKVLALEAEASELTYHIADAEVLLAELEDTLTKLREGGVARSSLGAIEFSFCPSCFTPLIGSDDDHRCSLCKADIDEGNDELRFVRMRGELEMQLKESRHLQGDRNKKLLVTKSDLNGLTAIRDVLAAEYVRIGKNYLTDADAQIEHLLNRVGYFEREVVEIERERGLAAQLDELSQNKASLNEEIARLKSNISVWKDQRDRTQSNVYRQVTDNTAKILSQDLHTEAEFSESSTVYFDFSEDRISVNGKSGFSASSLTVLRNAFHLALHQSSAVSKAFNYPRFLLLDNIEDKGMTEARSQNFQRLIMQVSSTVEAEHQIIFTTSMIDPALDRDDLTVGELYDFNNKALKIQKGA